jgi:hypothetical protein
MFQLLLESDLPELDHYLVIYNFLIFQLQEDITSLISTTRIRELGTTLAVTSNQSALQWRG